MGVNDLQQRLTRGAIIALDTVTFIYHFEDNPQYAPLTQVVFDAIEGGQVTAVTSMITVAEVLTGAKKAGHPLILQYRALFAGYPNLTIVPVDMQIAERASDILTLLDFTSGRARSAVCGDDSPWIVSDEPNV